MLSKNNLIINYYKTIQNYCLSCRKHTDSIGSKKVIMTIKVVRAKSRYANYMVDKSRFLKRKHNKNVM